MRPRIVLLIVLGMHHQALGRRHTSLKVACVKCGLCLAIKCLKQIRVDLERFREMAVGLKTLPVGKEKFAHIELIPCVIRFVL